MTLRGSSLRTIRNRVDRLSAACKMEQEPEILFIQWIHPHEHCPFCGYDLDAHSRAAALADAQAAEGPDAPPRGTVLCWVERLDACPACCSPLS